MSTLSDTYFGEGAADPGTLAEPRTDDMVDVSMISSEQGMYVFEVGRQRRRPAVQLKRRSRKVKNEPGRLASVLSSDQQVDGS